MVNIQHTLGKVFLLIYLLSLPLSATTPSLSIMNFTGAGVLPQFFSQGKKYVLLSREAYGKSKGFFDGFGGSRDKNESHPVVTASREFAEETIGILMNPKEAKKYIDIDSGHTELIVANVQKKGVIFITNFSQQSIEKLEKNFYRTRNSSLLPKYREKDKLARVEWSDLVKVIQHAPLHLQPTQKIMVPASVLQTNGKFISENVPLRPSLISMLRPYLLQQQFTPGKNPKIHFY